MKVYSWNVKFNNRKKDEIIEHINSVDFDICSLQEVTPDILAAIQSNTSHEVVFCIDARTREGVQFYNVVVSRLPIIANESFDLTLPQLPLRSRLFIRLMWLYGWRKLLQKQALYADIQVGNKLIRFFSFHATLFGPDSRLRELNGVFEKINNASTIIAGDFNIFELSWLKILNWLMGAPLSQGLPWYAERSRIEKVFREHNLENPLRGNITHRFSQSQLDHILVPQQLKVKKAWVEKNSHGSDHNPVGVELEL